MEPVLEYLFHALRSLRPAAAIYEVYCNRLQIASELSEKIKETIADNRDFGLDHGLELLRLKKQPEPQLEIAERFVHQKMTTPKPLTLTLFLTSLGNSLAT